MATGVEYMTVEELSRILNEFQQGIHPAYEELLQSDRTERQRNQYVPAVTFNGVPLRTPRDILGLDYGAYKIHLFDGLPGYHQVIEVLVDDQSPMIRRELERFDALRMVMDESANRTSTRRSRPSLPEPSPITRSNAVRAEESGVEPRELFRDDVESVHSGNTERVPEEGAEEGAEEGTEEGTEEGAEEGAEDIETLLQRAMTRVRDVSPEVERGLEASEREVALGALGRALDILHEVQEIYYDIEESDIALELDLEPLETELDTADRQIGNLRAHMRGLRINEGTSRRNRKKRSKTAKRKSKKTKRSRTRSSRKRTKPRSSRSRTRSRTRARPRSTRRSRR